MKNKLDRKDYFIILVCILISVVCGIIAVKYFSKAFPEASIEFKVDRGQSREIAESFLTARGHSINDYTHSAIFDFDNKVKVFLERSLPSEEVADLLSTKVKLWEWNHRWFKPLEKEEFRVSVTPAGEISYYSHLIREEAEGANLESEDARIIAERWMQDNHGIEMEQMELLYAKDEKRPNRTDHIFTWKKPGIEVGDADYRIEVTVCGDQVTGYREYLKVPEEWDREYKELRSKNEVTGFVAGFLIILTVIAMIFYFAYKVRNHDIRWKTAIIFGAIAVVLVFFSSINAFNSSLYQYDTTQSMPGFLIKEILFAVLGAFFVGAFIFLLTASAEPIYREWYKDKISLSKTFIWRGIRTKTFFKSCIYGFTLTFFFMAYQTVLYLVAARYGAWAPADVPYSEMLNTVIPWVYVLFFGFYPAVSEEFISRMFSIPIIHKFVKSRWVAVIIPAFIWGFAHSNYPNQPFYIRGLEVGFAGIIIGVVMLRTNILTTLIWHYTVDALYTSLLLVRSGNTYFVVSAILATGVIAAPLVISLVSYLVKGTFADEEELTNGKEGSRVISREKVTFDIHDMPYQPMNRRRLSAGICISLLMICLLVWKVPYLGESQDIVTGRKGAIETCNRFLENRDIDPGSFHHAAILDTRVNGYAAKYILDRKGVQGVIDTYDNLINSTVWFVRFFKPGEKEEYKFSVDTQNCRITQFEHMIPETAEGTRYDRETALPKAEEFLKDQGFSMDTLELKEAYLKKEPNRNDHTFAWEARENDPRNVENTKYRIELKIQGDQIDLFKTLMKVPEQWKRERDEEKLYNIVSYILILVLLFTVSIVGVYQLLMCLRDGTLPWAGLIKISASLAVISTLSLVNGLNTMYTAYPTEYPMELFHVMVVVQVLLMGVGIFLLYTFFMALIFSLQPELFNCLHRRNRYGFFRDTIVAAVILTCFYTGITHMGSVFTYYFPSCQTEPSVGLSSSMDAFIPALSALNTTLLYTVLITSLTALLGVVLKRHGSAWLISAAVLLISILAGAGGGKTVSEILFTSIWTFVILCIILLLIRGFTRGNPIAIPFAAFITFMLEETINLITQSYSYFRLNGVLLLLVLMVIIFIMARKPVPVIPDQEHSSSHAIE